MSSEQENNENEANVDLKGVIKDLAEQIKKLTDIVEKSTKKINANTTANADWHKYQALMRIEQEKEHGRQVRLNKEYGRSAASLQMFTGLLTKGASAGFIFNKLANTIGGVSKELDKFKQETAELTKLQKQYAGLDLSKKENLAEHDILAAQQARTDEAKEKVDEKQGGSGKLAEGISSMKAFAEKHKTGILIGAGSIGILLTVLKKAFDVSPMFQAIKKLLQFGFMLILRPIGDFFGFIMRPIMVMMLRKFIIPWYKDVYPVMKKLGTWIGNQLVPFVEDVANFFSSQGGQATAATAAGAVTATAIVKKLKSAKVIPAAAGATPSPKVPKVKTPSPAFPAPSKKPPILKLPAAITKPLAAIVKPLASLVKLPAMITKPLANLTKLPAVITKPLANLTKLPTVLSSGVNKAVIKSSNLIKNAVSPVIKTLSSPRTAAMAADALKMVSKVAKPLTRVIPIVGQVLAAVDIAGSAIKHYSPESYEGIRQGGLALGAMLGDTEGHTTEGVMDFFGFGKQSTAEQVMGGIGWAKDKIGMTTGAAGIGGGAGSARGNAGNGVTIFIDHVSNEADIQRMGNVLQERIQESNKRTIN